MQFLDLMCVFATEWTFAVGVKSLDMSAMFVFALGFHMRNECNQVPFPVRAFARIIVIYVELLDSSFVCYCVERNGRENTGF